MAIQKRNDEMVDLLAADFQRRYEMQFALANACSMFQQLPGLRGFWPMSACTAGAANAIDQSGHAHHLTRAGNPIYGLDLITDRSLAAYLRFDGTGDYLSRADEANLDITGTESYFASQASTSGAARGLTLGGWFRPELDTANELLISKWGVAGQRSYNLRVAGAVAGDPVTFYICDDGTNTDRVDSTTGYTVDTWQFMAGRFNDGDTGMELAVWLNDEQTTAATARASIFNSTAPFNISGSNNGSALYTGRASLCFLCAAALPDVVLWTLYQQTRALFGV